jgi:hypothetical protein
MSAKLTEEELKTFGESLDSLLAGVPVVSQVALLFHRLEALYTEKSKVVPPPPQLAKMFLDGCSFSAGAKSVESKLLYVAKVTRADGACRVFTHAV